MITNENNLQLITKLVALVVQMKVRSISMEMFDSFLFFLQEFSESEGSFLELHAIDEANKHFQQFLHPSLLT